MFKNTRLETERLTLRPFNLNDAESLHGIVSQNEVMRFLPEDTMSLEQVRRTISWLNECYEKNTPQSIIKFTLTIIRKENQKLIGWCGLGPLDFNPEEIEIFFGLSKDHWGRGIATEAGKAMLHFGFNTIKLVKIVAIADPRNVASVRVIEKLGMVYKKMIGKLPKEEHSFYEGCLYYSLSRDEYLQMTRS